MFKDVCFRKLALTLFIPMFLLLAFASNGAAYDENPGEGVTVKPARASWTTGFILEAIYTDALEDLGYEVRHYKELSNPIFYQAVVNGDVDFWANGWFPLHNEALPDNFEEKASTVGYVVKRGALQGYLASKDAVEKYNIESIADFKREEVKKAFDANGDGKADLVACPPGWGCEKVISHHFDYYNMGEYINPIKAAYSASMADAVTRHKNGEPVFFYTWTPNWTVYKLRPGKDVMWINVPKIKPTPGQKGLEGAMVASGVKGAVTDPVKMGFVANDIRCVANDEFLEENPAAKKLFEVMSVPLADIAAQNAKMFQGEDSQEDIEKHAQDWIKKNKKQWELWLGEARAAAK
ncbi:MAG TPA: glycine betaine/L-proline ABC transporter substrate-binding protein ProX [Desulfohalobiaceae bacterium]|nr:glycine betaine/L-proline ABC transporter substrate-binding protein ProX [Desulfohalobiaceae bacterium]